MSEKVTDAARIRETQYTLLLSTIKRWIKIELGRDQNVAEHSFNVSVLALGLFDFIQGETPHNSFERTALLEWALVHDLDEVETGDIPADFKNAVRAITGEAAVDQAVDNLMAVKAPTFVAKKRGMKDSFPYDVVKIADKLEEILYNQKYGRNARADDAQADALRLLRQRLVKAEKAHPRYDWERARIWLSYFLRPVYEERLRPDFPRMAEVLGPA